MACSSEGDDGKQDGTLTDPIRGGAGTMDTSAAGQGMLPPSAAGTSGQLGAAGTLAGAPGASVAGTGGMDSADAAMPLPDDLLPGPGTCESLPPVSDYAAPGPFADAKMFSAMGPNANYTLFRPDASLGKDGFKHPIVAWGNGISTTPDQYKATLTLIATHGFVVIACNDTRAERACLAAGLDWLVEQNASGEFQGKLDVTRELTVGYSWGGGAAIDTANRPNVRATVSLHGMPPRETDAFGAMHSPLLLFTSTGDSFVTAEEYVTPNYEQSQVQTFYATLDDPSAGHLYPVDVGSISCVAATLGTCQTAKLEQAPVVAWLRLWACGDEGAQKFFYGDDCTLCQAPWAAAQRKAWK